MTPTLVVIAAGLTLGFAGSGHCAVMCGPLVLLSHPREATPRGVAAHVTSYHAGRLLSYVILGALLGMTGGALATTGFGPALAYVAAAVLLFQAVWQWRLRAAPGWPALTRAIGVAGRWMRQHTTLGPAVFGALTGLLPCGLVYAALTASIGLGGAANGAVFMLAFGLGSLPLLAAIGMSADRLRVSTPARVLRNAAPIGLAIVALVLVLRASGVHAQHSSEKTQAHHHEGTTPSR